MILLRFQKQIQNLKQFEKIYNQIAIVQFAQSYIIDKRIAIIKTKVAGRYLYLVEISP